MSQLWENFAKLHSVRSSYKIFLVPVRNFFDFSKRYSLSYTSILASKQSSSIPDYFWPCMPVSFFYYSKTPPIRMLVIRTSNYPERLGPSGKFVENSTKLTCLEITVYRIKYSTVLWLKELQIRRIRKVWTQIYAVNSNRRTSNCQILCSVERTSLYNLVNKSN